VRGLPFENAYNTLLNQCKKERRDIKVELTYKEFVEFSKIKSCHYCGDPVNWIPYGRQQSNLDRVDNTLGYSIPNCVVCCTVCNKMKRDMRHEKFIQQCQKVASQVNLVVS
jgi:hypothetical protein